MSPHSKYDTSAAARAVLITQLHAAGNPLKPAEATAAAEGARPSSILSLVKEEADSQNAFWSPPTGEVGCLACLQEERERVRSWRIAKECRISKPNLVRLLSATASAQQTIQSRLGRRRKKTRYPLEPPAPNLCQPAKHSGYNRNATFP